MPNQTINAGIAAQIGKYSDAVAVPAQARWLYVSGTPGLTPDGKCPPGIAAQAEQAWRNLSAILEQGGMELRDLVKVTHYLVRAEDIKPYVEVRARFLGELRPASMLIVVPALVRAEFLVEIEAYAARPG
jgi:2-iminobutanoate/2-iminopropanoate deaminase